jgi:hypothetical protein
MIKIKDAYTRKYFSVYRDDDQDLTAEQALDAVRQRFDFHNDAVTAVRLINYNERLVIIEEQGEWIISKGQ